MHDIDSIDPPSQPAPSESGNHLATDSFAKDLDYSNPESNVLHGGARKPISEQRSINDVDDSYIP